MTEEVKDLHLVTFIYSAVRYLDLRRLLGDLSVILYLIEAAIKFVFFQLFIFYLFAKLEIKVSKFQKDLRHYQKISF